MKKTFALLASLVASTAAYATPVLNPGLPHLQTEGVFMCDDGCGPRCWSLRYGYRGDFIYDAKLEDSTHTIDHYGLYTNAFTLTLNLWNRLDIWGLAGATSQDLASKYFNEQAGPTSVTAFAKIPFETKASWGVGARLLLWEKCWRYAGTSFLGVTYEYWTTRYANSKSWTLDGLLANSQGGTATARYRAQGAALAWGQRIKKLVPYIALKWSTQRVNLSGTGANGPSTAGTEAVSLSGLHSQRHWGWAVGTTLLDFCRMNITGEARFIDEKAATVTAEMRF